MDLNLTGKRAIVTGGSRGIGLAVANGLADEGVDVVLVARDRAALEQAATRVSRPGHRVLIKPTDTTDDDAVRRMVAEVAVEFGGVDILVNSAAVPAGGASPPALAQLTDDELRSDFETKVLGYLRCARAVAPHMQAQGWGRIINISGLGARRTGSVSGSVRNVAVSAMTKNLADELGPSGINVTVVHPGFTYTERVPAMVADLVRRKGVTEAEAMQRLAGRTSIGRMVTAEEVASVVVFLASPLSVAMNGDPVVASGGEAGPIYY